MPEKPNDDNHAEEEDYTLHDLVEFSVSVNALLRRANRLLGMAEKGMPKRLLMMETAMTAESASRVAVLLAKSPETLDEAHVSDVYQTQYHNMKKGN
jgi:hypothetical protein